MCSLYQGMVRWRGWTGLHSAHITAVLYLYLYICFFLHQFIPTEVPFQCCCGDAPLPLFFSSVTWSQPGPCSLTLLSVLPALLNCFWSGGWFGDCGVIVNDSKMIGLQELLFRCYLLLAWFIRKYFTCNIMSAVWFGNEIIRMCLLHPF